MALADVERTDRRIFGRRPELGLWLTILTATLLIPSALLGIRATREVQVILPPLTESCVTKHTRQRPTNTLVFIPRLPLTRADGSVPGHNY
jgi:hypothetical protein